MKLILSPGAQFSYFDTNQFFRGAEYEGLIPAGTIDPAHLDREACEAYQRDHMFVCECDGLKPSTMPGRDFDRYSQSLKGRTVVALVDWITLKCNYKCPYCYVNSPLWTAQHPEARTVTRHSAQDRKTMVELIMDNVQCYMRYQMIGGEPTLIENWADIAEKVTEVPDVIFTLYTNASSAEGMAPLLNKELDPAKVEVVMAMHPSQEKFNADEFLRTAVKLKKHGYGLFVVAVDLFLNEPWVSQNQRIFHSLGIPITRYRDVRIKNPDFRTIKGVQP